MCNKQLIIKPRGKEIPLCSPGPNWTAETPEEKGHKII